MSVTQTGSINAADLSPKELIEFLKVCYTAVPKQSAMIWGDRGIGKSEIVAQVAKLLNAKYVPLILSQISPEDLRGVPKSKYSEEYAEEVLHYIRTTYLPPMNDTGRGVIFLDELPAAHPRLQVTVYQLLTERRIGNDYFLPDGWIVLAAGNRQEDGALHNPIGSAMADRFWHCTLVPTALNWLEWAQENDVHSSVLGFIKANPHYLNRTKQDDLISPSPRSWVKVSNLIKSIETMYDPGNIDAIKTQVGFAVRGLIGNEIAVTFMDDFALGYFALSISELMTLTSDKITEKIAAINKPTSLYTIAYGLPSLVVDSLTAQKALSILLILANSAAPGVPAKEISGFGINNLAIKVLKFPPKELIIFTRSLEWKLHEKATDTMKSKVYTAIAQLEKKGNDTV